MLRCCLLSIQGADIEKYRMSSQDIWLRKYHELWEKLEENTKSSFCTALWKWLVHKRWMLTAL